LLSTLDEGELVRRRSEIRNLFCFWVLVDHDSMADSEQAIQLVDFVAVGIFVLEHCVDFVARALAHADLLLLASLQISEYFAGRVALLEFHLVLGQRACFVRKNEFYLAQFLNQVRVAAQSMLPVLSPLHS